MKFEISVNSTKHTDFQQVSLLFVRNVRKAPNRGLESSLLPLLKETLSKPWMKNIYRALPALKTDDLNIYYKNENLLGKICLFYTPNRYQM